MVFLYLAGPGNKQVGRWRIPSEFALAFPPSRPVGKAPGPHLLRLWRGQPNSMSQAVLCDRISSARQPSTVPLDPPWKEVRPPVPVADIVSRLPRAAGRRVKNAGAANTPWRGPRRFVACLVDLGVDLSLLTGPPSD